MNSGFCCFQPVKVEANELKVLQSKQLDGSKYMVKARSKIVVFGKWNLA